MENWIKNLKNGDKVFIENRYGRYLRTVEKITNAGNIKANGIWFNSNGRERGGDVWNCSHLEEATGKEIIRYRQDLVIQKALKLMTETKKINYEQATKIIQVLSIDKEA